MPSAAVPKPRVRMTAAQRFEQLLDVAEALFLEQGYERTSIEAIARGAGVTRPMVYEHFGSKEGVYVSCVERGRERLAAKIIAAAHDVHDPYQALAAGADAWFRAVEEEPERWLVLYEGGVGPASDEMRKRLDDLRTRTAGVYVELFRGWANDSVDENLLWAAGFSMSGIGEQIAKWWTRCPDVSRAEAVGLFMKIAWGGVSPFARV